jgi:low affinity Fe/Cu permease
MATEPQTYANHKRVDPWYHYMGFGLALLILIMALAPPFRGHGGAWQILVALFLLLMFLRLRIYALRVQDRIIRLEETLRMQALLDQSLRDRIHELRPGQFVALRFASDGELATRVAEALDEGLSGAEIKKRILSWRADTFRV